MTYENKRKKRGCVWGNSFTHDSVYQPNIRWSSKKRKKEKKETLKSTNMYGWKDVKERRRRGKMEERERKILLL